MKRINTSPISGMQELLPDQQAIFNEYKTKIEKVYRLHGFLNIETPMIDRNEVLFAKAGGDTEKQIYRVIKTDEGAEDSTQSLRFDHTVPLARYVVEHESSLNFPFQVSQIGRNFRGERAQKGRYREFYQCDVDVIGRNSLPLFYDAQVIYTFFTALSSFVQSPVRVRINNRKFVSGFIEALDLTEFASEIYSIIDHSEKVPAEKTIEYLLELGIEGEKLEQIKNFIATSGSFEDIMSMLEQNALSKCDLLQEGISELQTVIGELKKMGLNSEQVVIDLKIVRGLDYYTGTVFEANLPEHPEIGSIGGGGRYENLASNFTEQKFPGVGASIGLTRLFYILSENHLIAKKEEGRKLIKYAIIPMSQEQSELAYHLAAAMRRQQSEVIILPIEKKLGDTLKLASKIAENGIVLGENEASQQACMVKNFATSNQSKLNFDKLLNI